MPNSRVLDGCYVQTKQYYAIIVCKQDTPMRFHCSTTTVRCSSCSQTTEHYADLVCRQYCPAEFLHAKKTVTCNSFVQSRKPDTIMVCKQNSLVEFLCADETVICDSSVQPKKSHSLRQFICAILCGHVQTKQYYTITVCKQDNPKRFYYAAEIVRSDSCLQANQSYGNLV